MEIKCSIIKDLLPLYIEGDCSQETKECIEEHLASCSACSEICSKMRSPLLIPSLPENTEKKPRKKPFNAKRAFSKIRRRWAASLFAVVLFIPLLYLSVNQFRGEGLSFTGIPGVLHVNAMLSAIEDENYTKAYSYLGIEEIFNEYSTVHEKDYTLQQNYTLITVGGTSYYALEQIAEKEYAVYLQDNNEKNFWLSILSADEIFSTPIPQHAMEEILQDTELLNSLNSAELDYNAIDTRELAETDYGSYYLYPAFRMEDALYCNALIVPEQLYLDHLNELEANRQEAQDYANQYKEMGFEAYNEECFESFCRNLENLKKNGIRFTGHRFVDASENGLTYALYVTTASGETVVLHTEFGMQNGMVTSDYFTQDTPDIVEKLHITPIQLYYFYYED